MEFRRLRLVGFKSFVDPTELVIEPGLTGVVGPNGCGKSNLLEALRWVMGESSARSMRGAGMEDVIFAGTTGRPARAFAEVSLSLDNRSRQAPAGLNDADELEVIRRIERDLGSAYRVNGKDARQKDVQLLFADAATGAHSPALVSQGRIGALITAKPQDRRAILEEAAGISGLHSRRKEAESRLRGVEANLAKLDDVLVQMEGQQASLQRQARQAERYRALSADIRRIEAMVLYARWAEAAAALTTAEAGLKALDAQVQALTSEVAQASTAQAEAAAALPDLRAAEAAAAAARQRLTLAHEELAAERNRVAARQAELTRQLADISRDQSREAQLADDARAALSRLASEAAEVAQRLGAAEAQVEAGRARVADAETTASGGERQFDALSQRHAEAVARRRALEQQADAARQRRLRLEQDARALDAERERLLADSGGAAAANDALAVLSGAEARLAGLEARIDAAEQARAAAELARDAGQARLAEARSTFAAAQDAERQAIAETERMARSRASSLETEVATLKRLLASSSVAATAPGVIEAMTVAPGYEGALAAALADDLKAPLGTTAARRWSDTAPDALADPALPGFCTALSAFVQAPVGLARRLAQIGVVETAPEAAQLAALQVGQRLVTRAGELWRWDGFIALAPADPGTAERLAQRNRLAALEPELAQARVALETAIAAAAASRTAQAAAKAAQEAAWAGEASGWSEALAAASQAERKARTERRDIETQVDGARKRLAQAQADAARRETRLQGLADSLTRLREDIAAREREAAQAEELMAGLPNLERLALELADQRRVVERQRQELASARAAFDTLQRAIGLDRDRCASLARDQEGWTQRVQSGAAQAEALAARATAAQAELDQLATRPDAIAAELAGLADRIGAADTARQAAADRLAEAEAAQTEADRRVRERSEALSVAREQRARVDAQVESQGARRQELSHAIGEAYQCPPPLLPEKTGFDETALPALGTLEPQLERLRGERERLGAVNLRADIELAELRAQAEQMVTERAELQEAVNKLRAAVGSLNREGRQRLMAAFDVINGHFARLFRTLFGGGEAHLALIESDDPLEAGLEIMASPPGKRLQHLSLLSGGEQALTATALIFAVFLTNPAPICVLDEVDAPLDDANVERFCDLLDAMVRETNTRFLIVTHNAVTMSRMDRLFGVTMAERGVSQLVSVDLRRAEHLLAAE
jgi:chromosome segregation protein